MPWAAASWVRRTGSGGTGSGSLRSRAGWPAAATNWSNPPGETTTMIRPGPACETWKPCGIPCGKNTSEPGPARYAWSPQNPSKSPSRTRNASSLASWTWGGGANPAGTR